MIQAAIPRILIKEKDNIEYLSIQKFSIEYKNILRENVKLCKELLKDNLELSIIEPYSTIYMMIKINLELFDSITNDEVFTMKLLEEENLFLLPGKCFGMHSYIRLVNATKEYYIIIYHYDY